VPCKRALIDKILKVNKMRKNNFDSSSSGLNIELSIFRDTDRSQLEFDESFTRLEDGLFVFTEFGNVSDNFSFSDASNYRFTVKELRQAIKKDYDTELSQHYFSKPFSKLTKVELLEFLDCLSYDSSEVAEFFQTNFTSLYDTLATRGHCQRDYAEVIISPAYKAHLADNGQSWGNPEVKTSIKTEIGHLFWDAPIHAMLFIGENEFYLHELLAYCYEYDKDHLMLDFERVYSKEFSEDQLAIVMEFLADNLPEYPDYQ
jgi:hypothetical protein